MPKEKQAPEGEIEITPEMVERAIGLYWNGGWPEDPYSVDRDGMRRFLDAVLNYSRAPKTV